MRSRKIDVIAVLVLGLCAAAPAHAASLEIDSEMVLYNAHHGARFA